MSGTLNEVLRYTGCTYRQLDYWSRRGLIHPRNDGGGSGCPREWPFRELRVARAMGKLLAAGLTLDVAARVARAAVEDAAHAGVTPYQVEIGPGIRIELVAA